MVLAGVLGVTADVERVLRSADDTRPVLVAAHDLAPGTVISDASVHVARIHADTAVLATLFGGEQLAAMSRVGSVTAGRPPTASWSLEPR